jgi:hypothetical protein
MTEHDTPPPDRLAELLELSGPRPAPSSEGYERARMAARDAWQAEVRLTQRHRLARLAVVGLAAAAALVVALARFRTPLPTPDVDVARVDAATGLLRVGNETLVRGDRVRTNMTIGTAPGARAALRLNNGVEVRLDVGTDLRFLEPALISLDRGALFVDTHANSASPQRLIEIRTATATARDVGTVFEVRMTSLGMRVRVRDGRVDVESRGRLHTADAGIELLAGASDVARRAIGTTGPDWNWITLAGSSFIAEGKTLTAFLDWAAREGGWQIQFEDDALERSASTVVIHGSIDGLTPGQALDAILPTCGLTHRIDRDTVIVTRSGGRR